MKTAVGIAALLVAGGSMVVLASSPERIERGAVATVTATRGTSIVVTPTVPPIVSPPSPLSLVEGFDTTPAPDVAPPVLGSTFVDPVYGTTISRATGASQVTDRDLPDWVRHEYSRKQAFNADSTQVLIVSSNGWYRLYRVDGTALKFVRTLDIAENQEAIWHPSDPDQVFVFGGYGSGSTISTIDVRNDAVLSTRNLDARFEELLGPSAARAWTKQEGSPSTDGRVWCLQVETDSYDMVGLIAYDLVTDRILGSLATTDRPDHVSTSPSGAHCVPSWTSGKGTRAYTTDFSRFTQLHSKSEHSDLARTADGRDVYVFADYDSGDVAMVDLATGARTDLFALYGPNSAATGMHISGRADRLPGWVLISFYGCTERYGAVPCPPGAQWFDDKVVAVQLATNPRVLNIAHIRYGDAGYWGEPQATVDRDFTKILFASSWGSTNETDLSSYLVTLPPGTVR